MTGLKENPPGRLFNKLPLANGPCHRQVQNAQDNRGTGQVRHGCIPAMGIVTQWATRLQTSDFYGPSPPTPNTQAPHDRPSPPPPISD